MSALPEPSFADQYSGLVASWRDDPFAFFREVLGIDYVTPDQERLVRALMTHRHVACTAGQSVGKSWISAAICLWFVCTNPDSIVITTSASAALVEDVTWREIRKLYSTAKIPLGGELLKTELSFSEKWYMVGLSTNDPTRFQGRHSKRVLVVIDEATGVDGSIFEAAEAMAVGATDKLLATANPTDPTGAFYEELFPRNERPSKWHHVTISCETHPNVLAGKELIPGAVSREWVEQRKLWWGEDSPAYDARVRGVYSKKLGRMFPDWNPARHVYDPASVVLHPWFPRWIGIDWGFSHDTAALFAAWDGHTIYIYDEIVVNDTVASALGEMIGQRANAGLAVGASQDFEGVYLAHDAFGHQGETTRTRAEMMSESLLQWELPAASRASTDRIGGWNLITGLLRTDGLRVSKVCVDLIKKFPEAVRDPKKPEDMLKVDGDDSLDACYKLVMARTSNPVMPREMRIAQRTAGALNPNHTAMLARIAESDEKRAVAGGSFVSMRRGWRNQ